MTKLSYYLRTLCVPFAFLGLTTTATAQEVTESPTDVLLEKKAAFAQAALALVQQAKVNEYKDLIPSIEHLSQWCADMVSQRGEKAMRSRLETLARQTQENLPACNQMIDWSKAQQIRATGGEIGGPVPGCVGMTQIKDFKFTFEISGKTYIVKLDDPFVRDGEQFGFMGDPECTPE